MLLRPFQAYRGMGQQYGGSDMSLGIGGAGRQNPFLAQQAQGSGQPNQLLTEDGAQVPALALQGAKGCCGPVVPDVTQKLNAIG